jgi:hypothetical protein
VDNVDDPAAASALTGLLGQLTTGHVAELLLQLTKSVHSFTDEDRAQARLLAENLG